MAVAALLGLLGGCATVQRELLPYSPQQHEAAFAERGPHRGVMEWWYLTGVLECPAGRGIGLPAAANRESRGLCRWLDSEASTLPEGFAWECDTGIDDPWPLLPDLFLNLHTIRATLIVCKEGYVTRNVTLRMDEQLLRKLQHKAVDAGMSLSAWIASTLEALVPDGEEITHARARSLARLERGLHLGGDSLNRDELHAR